ncbi:MAG: DMT family transporter [Ignavibacteria bacterium]|nr:DMT family transporter [Ignavibacteria bacterium]MDH7527052.1 EamA family transporter [Ignavibacteria bacterium]
MMWIPLAFGVALFDSLKNVLAKHTLKDIDEYTVAWANSFFSAVFLIPILFFELPEIKPMFFVGLIVSGTLNILALIFFMKSIKSGDLSNTVPLTTLSPLLLLITSPIIVGEFPSFQGMLGMIAIVVGAYLLNFKQDQKDFLSPFRSIFKEKGPRYMLLVVLIWAITANFDKIGVVNSSPLFYSFSVQLYIGVLMLTVVIPRFVRNPNPINRNLKSLIGVGFLSTLTIICHMLAISLTIVPYVISIKRTNSILSVVFGRLFFKEGYMKERFSAAVLMFIGVLLITFS